MIELTTLDACPFSPNDQVVCALGFFDGVHQAHRIILETCKRRARERGGLAVVFTFQNHPGEIVAPERSVPLLMPYPLKKRMIASLEMDGMVALPFTEAFSRIAPEQFVKDVLIECLHAREVVVGFDFHYGYKRSGSASNLQELVPDVFEHVTVVERQHQDSVEISSTRIREAVTSGRLDQAEAWLGHPYTLGGTVIRGDGRGHTIGIPTANLDYRKQLLPPNGVYGVRVYRDSFSAEPLPGVMNIGVLPTFRESGHRTVEIHLPDWQGDLYGTFLMADILFSIRGEMKFDGPASLVDQINRDIAFFREQYSSR